jgi:HK97 family phage major capsid protein
VARSVVDAWLIEEQGSDVIRVITQNSAAETLFTPEPMRSYTKTIPRSGAVGVSVIPKGSTYPEDAGTVDEITIIARKFGTVVRLAEEDIEDGLFDIVTEKKTAWANQYATIIDNATLATTAATNGTTVPFTSVYKTVRTADAAVGYTADANYAATTTATNLSYANLRNIVKIYEASPYFDPANTVVIAHPAFKDQLRGVLDNQGRPIFTDAGSQSSDTFFGYQIKFSLGAKTSAVATATPTGNAILVIGNRNLLRLGKRSGPESFVADPDSGVSMQTDEALLKLRSRRGFVVGDARGVAVLELIP